jgi:hypothetical protein
MSSTGMQTAVVAGVATGVLLTEAEKRRKANEKRYNEEQANLPGNDEKCVDKCKKDFTCYNQTCISDILYNNLTRQSMDTDKTALVLAIVLPILLLLFLLGGIFAPQISAFFKKSFRKK